MDECKILHGFIKYAKILYEKKPTDSKGVWWEALVEYPFYSIFIHVF